MRTFLVLALISIACMQLVSGHAYFSSPVPREMYCTQTPNCTAAAGMGPSYPGAQGPVWQFNVTAHPTYNADPTTAVSCGTSNGVFVGSSANPTGTGTIMATWTAGQSATVSVFISEIHTTENMAKYPTDGWEIRYRDATVGTSTFTPFPVTAITGLSSNTGVTYGTGPFPSANFVQGTFVTATVTVPNQVYSDMEIQFIWSQSAVQPGIGGGNTNGAMWLSCADVAVTMSSTSTAPSGGGASPLASSSIAMFIPALFLALYALF